MGVQVDLLTKDKTCHEKEFIDFEFDGKHISEFGMVAVNSGDRHSFSASPEFEDETSEVNGVSGQYYWGTRFKTKTLSFSLATDGMTEAQVNAFKIHFRPGKYGKFIEDKLAGRYGYARISAVTNFSVVPFKKITKVRGVDVEINEYKGDASLSFIFDEPLMFSTKNVLELSTTQDSLRLMYNNGTPMADSWDSGYLCHVGDGALIKNNGAYELRKGDAAAHTLFSNAMYFYNPSNIPSKAKISIAFRPTFTMPEPSGNSLVYFCEIFDSVNTPQGQPQHNTIVMKKSSSTNTLSPLKDNLFYYTSPNVIYQINKSIKIAGDFFKQNLSHSVLKLEEKLRLEIVNSKVIGWAASVLRIMKTKGFYDSKTDCFNNKLVTVNLSTITGGGTACNLNWLGYFNIYMLCMLAKCTTENYHLESSSWEFSNYTIVFDGENSQTLMTYSYNQITDTLHKIQVSEESCGDMICSPYLKLDGGDILNEAGKIATTHALQFYQGLNTTPDGIVSASLEYKHTYL